MIHTEGTDMVRDIYSAPHRTPQHEREVELRRAGYALLALASALEALPADAATDDVERRVEEVAQRLTLRR